MAAAPNISTRQKGLKLPAYVIIPLILAFVLAGTWFVWNQLSGPKPADLSQFEPNDSPAARARARFLAQPTTDRAAASGVIRRDDGSGDVHIPGARARFIKAKDGWRLNLAYIDQRFIPPLDRRSITARFLAITNPADSAKAGIAKDSVEKLRALKVVNEMVASDANRKTLTDLWSQYGTAPDAEHPAIEQKLITALRQTATASMAATTATDADYTKQIDAILTPTQIETLTSIRRGLLP